MVTCCRLLPSGFDFLGSFMIVNLRFICFFCGFLFVQELRMYNPNYLQRPYIVVLNKIDVPEVY